MSTLTVTFDVLSKASILHSINTYIMKTSIKELQDISSTALTNLGFNSEEVTCIVDNITAGELSGKASDGFQRVPWLKRYTDAGEINLTSEELSISHETATSLLLDGKSRTGFYVANEALKLGIEKTHQSPITIVGCTNTAPTTNYMNFFAEAAAEAGLISIMLTNSPGGVAPYGSIDSVFGTNPIVIGIPYKDTSFVLDMATSSITYGKVLRANNTSSSLPEGVVIDADGNPSVDPADALAGAILPFGGHKGSGLAFAVELLAGAFTSSLAGSDAPGGWGTTMILVRTDAFGNKMDFEERTESLIQEVKNSRRADPGEEIYYPGERSARNRKQNLEKGVIDIDDVTYNNIKEITGAQ